MKYWMMRMSIVALLLLAPSGLRAACVPTLAVEEWLTTDTKGEAGLLGYRMRWQKKQFSCSWYRASDPLVTFRVMAVYLDLPEGLEMVEYVDSEPWNASAPQDSESPAKTYTILYVGDANEAALGALEKLLATGEIELLMVRKGVELPGGVAEQAPVLFWVSPGTEPERWQVGDALFSSIHFTWATHVFFELQPSERR